MGSMASPTQVLVVGAGPTGLLMAAELDSPFPFMLSLPQSETERLLTGHLASFGMPVEWGVRLRRLSRTMRA
jgi:hypothetical protein